MNPRPLGVDAEQHHWNTEAEVAMHTRPGTDTGAVGDAFEASPIEGQTVLPHKPPEPAVDLRQLCRVHCDRIRTDFAGFPSWCVPRLTMHRCGHQDTHAGCDQR